MKKLILTITIIALFLTISNKSVFAQQDTTGKKEYHIKMIKVDDGKKTELDTIVSNNEAFLWKGDTIQPEGEMIFIDDSDFLIKKFEYDVGDDDLVFPGKAAAIFFRDDCRGKNIIDLSDPGIISYNKKDLKDGLEKITIVRKKRTETDEANHIIVKSVAVPSSDEAREMRHEIKVTEDENGKFIIIDNSGEAIDMGQDEDVKVIKKDGKTYVVKKTEKGKETEVTIDIEEEKEKK